MCKTIDGVGVENRIKLQNYYFITTAGLHRLKPQCVKSATIKTFISTMKCVRESPSRRRRSRIPTFNGPMIRKTIFFFGFNKKKKKTISVQNLYTLPAIAKKKKKIVLLCRVKSKSNDYFLLLLVRGLCFSSYFFFFLSCAMPGSKTKTRNAL